MAALTFAVSVFSAHKVDITAVEALDGNKWTGRNGNGVPCFDYSMGNQRLRLEDVRIVASGSKGYEGTFTVTNRRRAAPDPHLFVVFKCENGKVSNLTFKSDG